jgi:hypothetical protein
VSSLIEKIIGLPEPDLTDAFGTKWWLDKAASDYASRADKRGITLGAEVWLIEELNGDQKFVLVANQKVLYECYGLAAMGEHIDRLKAK